MSKNGIAWLPTKEARQIAKLDLAAAKRGESYNRDLLPTKYVGDTVVNTPNPGGLQPHRPWISSNLPPALPSGQTYSREWFTNGPYPVGAMTFNPPVFTYNVIGCTITGPNITEPVIVTAQFNNETDQTQIEFTPSFTYTFGTYVFTAP